MEIAVDNIKDCEAALAFIEDECKVTFNKSIDTAVVRERQFSAEGLGFCLNVKIRYDSPTCKQVIIGYETVPKYELRCDEEQPAKNSEGIDNEIPF